MQLHRELSITEGQGPVPAKLTLAEIIKDGKVTNAYQTYVLAWVSEVFKDGIDNVDFTYATPFSPNSQATSSAVQTALKELTPDEQVLLAQYLLDCIENSGSVISGDDMSIQDWQNYVLRRQD